MVVIFRDYKKLKHCLIFVGIENYTCYQVKILKSRKQISYIESTEFLLPTPSIGDITEKTFLMSSKITIFA